MRKKRFLKRSVIVSWIVSYTLMMFIPIAVSGIILGRSINTTKMEVEKVYRNDFKQMSSALDSELEEIKRVALELSLNREVLSFVFAKEIGTNERYNMYTIQKRLRDYAVTNQHIDRIIIGCPATNTAISNQSNYQIDYIAKNIVTPEFYDRISSTDFKNYFELIDLPNSDEKRIAFVVSLPFEPGDCDAFLLIVAKPSITSQLDSGLNSKSFDIIINNSQTSIGGNPNDIYIDNKSYISFSCNSIIPNIKYNYYVSSNEFSNAINQIKLITYTGFALCILMFAPILIFFLKNNYYPLRKIIVRLNNSENAGLVQFANEYEYIEKTTLKIQNENIQLEKEIDQAKPHILDMLLIKALQNSISTKELLLNTEGFDFFDVCDNFIVVIAIKPLEYKLLFFENGEEKQNLILLQVIITNIMRDFYSEELHIHTINIANTFVTVAIGSEVAISHCLINVASIPEILKTSFNASVCIGISNRHYSISEISNCYNEAREAMDFCEVFNKDCTAFQKDHKMFTDKVTGTVRTIDVTNKFRNSLSVGEFAASIDLLSPLFEYYFKDKLSISMVHLNMSSIINVFRCALADLIQGKPNTAMDIDPIVEKLLSCCTIEQLRIEMEYSIMLISKSHRINNPDSTSELVRDAIEFIKQNYSDYALTASSIAEHFDVSISKLSKAFKKETDSGILDFIHRVKINQAKILLDEQKYSINTISQMVGYNDASSFIRTFKKYEGVSPGRLSE